MKNSLLTLGGRALVLALLAITFLPVSALAAGENYGQVAGYVYDPTGAPIAEVPLTLSGPALQQPQTTTSGEDGRFEFALAPPGENYTLEVKVEGFAPIKKTGIIVLLGRTSPVDVKLEVLTETQAVATYEIVTQVNPLINPDSAQTGAVLTAEKVASTPVFTQVQAIPQLVAGVGPGNAPSSRGGLSRYGKSFVDGMDTTDVTDGSITAPLNFYAVENFEVITGGMDAQYNSLGMIENVVTKSGSNEFTYDVTMVLSPAWANAKGFSASNQSPAVGSFTQNTTPQSETSFYSPLVSVGGPIIKNRLWFYASGQWNLSHQETPITLPGEALENRPKDTDTRLARLKLTYQPTDKDRISVAFNYDRNQIDNNNSNSSTALDAESNIDRGGFFLIANYDRTITENMLFQLSAGTTYKSAHFGPQSGDENAISHNDGSVTRFSPGGLNGKVSNLQDESKRRFQFDPTLTFKMDKHQMKGGLQFGYLTGDITQSVTGNQRYQDRNGICDPEDPTTFQFCQTRTDFYDLNGEQKPLTTDASVMTLGAFLQDRFTINRYLTVVGGLRFDAGRLYSDDGQFITNLTGFGPRLSGTYDVFGDRNTLITAFYGRSNDIGDVFVAQSANPELAQVTASWTGTAFAECAPFVAATGCRNAGGATGRVFDKDAKTPHVDELSFGLRQAVGDKAAVGADFTYRKYSNMWVDEEINQLWDPSGTRIIGYVDPSQPQAIVKLTTPDDAWRDYRGMDLWVQGKAGAWDLLANYTLAFANGTVGNYFDGYGDNPRMKSFFKGPNPDDIRHTIKGSIGYVTDFGLDFGFRFRYLTGTPLWMTMQNPTPNNGSLYRSPRGTGYTVNANTGRADLNEPSNVAILRNPDQFIIDAQARYDVGRPLGLKQKLELTFLVVNLLNNTDATALNQTYNTANQQYGSVFSRSRPLQAELLLRFRN
ncbi:TonB-dependent receptor [Hyalangium gracile]|uniref:TonB-dependent receptor n=1 Tax=Hyalangium gracile TaxID=394092 RepID=UPI001CCADACF|nr:TonB-dependent receptor [Hyalangium gracile]